MNSAGFGAAAEVGSLAASADDNGGIGILPAFSGLDVPGVPVTRSTMTETTALGAAYAAGLAMGFWRDTGELRTPRGQDEAWTPPLAPEARDRLFAGWKKAVTRTFDWVGERDFLSASGGGARERPLASRLRRPAP